MEEQKSKQRTVRNIPDSYIETSNASKTFRLQQLKGFPHMFWLFTESNFLTFVLPNTAFGIFGALSGTSLTTHGSPTTAELLQRLPLVTLFNWSNVFIFDLANQRLPESKLEDLVNKPWRPLPTGKITSEQTRTLMLVAIPAVLAINFALGVWQDTALILVLTWLYNDLRGGDGIMRDLIIAVAFAIFNRGSLKLATSQQTEISHEGYSWTAIISVVILTTMQVQDLKDQAGDRGRGRRTIPLVFGDSISRWSIAGFVLLWSCCCASFWKSKDWAFASLILLGGYVASQAVLKRSPRDDRLTWRLWCLWLMMLYLLPILSH